MIDLREEKLTVSRATLSSYAIGWNDSIDNIKSKYNIITAPKTIKLSEIVSKFTIKDSFHKNHKISIIRDNGEIDVWEDYDIEVDETKLSNSYLLVVIANNKIKEINISYRHEELNKWLYALWIAGTEIVDDLKELKEYE